MTLEQAKHELLHPPTDPPESRSWLEANAAWLAVGAVAAGLLLGRPGRVKRAAKAALLAPMARRALISLVTGVVSRRIPSRT
jgi:hypothetical protein